MSACDPYTARVANVIIWPSLSLRRARRRSMDRLQAPVADRRQLVLRVELELALGRDTGEQMQRLVEAQAVDGGIEMFK